MAPKEKAIQLIYSFEALVDRYDEYELAKQCALIAADELIEHLQPASDFGGEINIYTVEYWQKVKQEIEKL
jgi:hypothetical protein